MATSAASEEVVFQTFSSSQVEQAYIFDAPTASLVDVREIEAVRAVITDSLPAGTQFVSDTRGAGAEPIDGDARFHSIKIPITGDDKTGAYLSLGLGRDRDMKDESDRKLATKMVAGVRLGLGEQSEAFVEYRQVRGFDWDGVSAPEHQATIGVTFKF